MPGPLDRIRSALARRIMPSAEREALFPPVQVERPTALAPLRPEPEPPQTLMPELDLGSGNMENAIEALRNAPMDRRGLMNMLRGASAAATVGRIAPLAAQAAPAVAEAVMPAVQAAAPAAPSVMSLMTDLMRSPFSHYPRVHEIERTLYDKDNTLSREEYRDLDREGGRLQDDYMSSRETLNRIHEWADEIQSARASLEARKQADELGGQLHDPDPYYVRRSDPSTYVPEMLRRGNFSLSASMINAIYQSGLPVDKFLIEYVSGVLKQAGSGPASDRLAHVPHTVESLQQLTNPRGYTDRRGRDWYLHRTMDRARGDNPIGTRITPEQFLASLDETQPMVRSMLPEDFAINPEAWENYHNRYDSDRRRNQ